MSAMGRKPPKPVERLSKKYLMGALDSQRISGMLALCFGSSGLKYGKPRRVKPVGFTASGAGDHSSEWLT